MYDPSDTFDLKVIERFLKSHQIIPDISVWYKVIGQPNDTDRQVPLTWANKNAMIICDDSIKIFQLFNYKSHYQSQRNCATDRSLWGMTFGDQLKQLNPLCITESTVAEDWSWTTAEQAEI